MGLGNRIKQDVDGAPGIGQTVTLGAAFAGFTGFADHHTDGDTVEYWIQEGANWEHGYGIYNTGTITRQTYVETLDGGVYDDSSPLPVLFGAGAEIFTSPTEDQRRDLPQPYIDGYSEAGDTTTLTVSGGVMRIPLDGRYYVTTIGVDALLELIDVPTPPAVASVEVDIIQDVTGNRAVTYPASWLWPDGTPVEVALDPGTRTRLVISAAPDGAVHADGSVRAAV